MKRDSQEPAALSQDSGELLFRHYQPGDEEAIVRLWDPPWDVEKALRYWRWRYLDNPFGPVLHTLAVRKADGRIVGNYADTPVPMNLKGKRVLGSQPVDLVVHPDYRHRGLFFQLAEASNQQRLKCGMKLSYGFPNDQALPGHIRKLDHPRILFLKDYAYRLRIYDQAKSVLRLAPAAAVLNLAFVAWQKLKLAVRRKLLQKQIARPLELRRFQTLPADYDQLWRKLRYFEILAVWKDAKYLRWRYDDKPDVEFEYFTLYDGDELVALAVTTSDPMRGVMLCELLVADRDALVARLLVTEMLYHFAGKKYSHLRFAGHDAGLFDQALAGFRRTVALKKSMLGGACDRDPVLEQTLTRPDYWTISYGDTDGY